MLILHEILHIDVFKDVDFKFDNILSKFQLQNYTNERFLLPNVNNFCFLLEILQF